MTKEEKTFTWIPFYMELAKALLSCKDNRGPLVEWIYSDLSKVSGRSLVNYLKMEDKSRIKDIDPFSLFAIFNRNLKLENRIGFLQKFKDKFSLKSEIPTDFDGIPTVNSQKAFFFNWGKERNLYSIQILWDLFENVVLDRDCGKNFDQVLANKMSKYSLTIVLYWISPYNFVSLDQRNRGYFQTLGLNVETDNFNFDTYIGFIKEIKSMMSKGVIEAESFPELSYKAWSLGQTDRIWMYNHYEDTFAQDIIKMGSSAKGKLDFSSYKNSNALKDAYQKVVDNKDNSIPTMYWNLMKEVKVGDIVVVFDSTGRGKTFCHHLYGWGRITSDVIYDYNDDNPIQRTVEWHRPLPDKPIKETGTTNTKYFHEVRGIDAANIMNLLDINGETESAMEKSNVDSFIKLLKTNKNLILTGAPGTGKTYLAKEIAKQMLGLETIEELKADKRFDFVQFHPSYDYTDFVEGLRPFKDVQNGVIGFKRQDGVFKEFCKHALGVDTAVFVIDEINRGEISKIFGELFFSIDPGYRGRKGIVKTQYQNMIDEGDAFSEGFFVPENVYIIGTMNDIDRSVESMDFAMRRRFAWKEVTAEDSMAMLDNNEELKDAPIEKLKARMRSLNKAILETRDLGKAYQIGASYFLKYANYGNFEDLWEYHLQGLLSEYLRGNINHKEELQKLKDAYDLKDETDKD